MLSFCAAESPFYLFFKGKELEARSSLQWLRGSHSNIHEEIDQIKSNIGNQRAVKTLNLMGLFSHEKYWRPFLACIVLGVFMQFSGLTAVVFYAQVIFDQAETKLSPCK